MSALEDYVAGPKEGALSAYVTEPRVGALESYVGKSAEPVPKKPVSKDFHPGALIGYLGDAAKEILGGVFDVASMPGDYLRGVVTGTPGQRISPADMIDRAFEPKGGWTEPILPTTLATIATLADPIAAVGKPISSLRQALKQWRLEKPGSVQKLQSINVQAGPPLLEGPPGYFEAQPAKETKEVFRLPGGPVTQREHVLKEHRLPDVLEWKEEFRLPGELRLRKTRTPGDTVFNAEVEDVTRRVPGGTMTRTILEPQYKWIDSPQRNIPLGMHEVLDVPAEVSTATPGRFKRWWQEANRIWEGRIRGAELPLVKAVPTSPVMSGVEGLRVNMEQHMLDTLKEPWVKAVLKRNPDEWKALEEQAVQEYERWAPGATGFRGSRHEGFEYASNPGSPAGYQKALETLPPEFREMLKWRDAQYAAENAARQALGLEPLREVKGPYFPRMTEAEWRIGSAPLRLHQEAASELQTTVGAFQQPRSFDTMLRGEKEGIHYQDPRLAFLYREVEGAQLRETEKLLARLTQDGILHETRAGALAASPTGEVGQVGKLWARSKEEAEFLGKNLKAKQMGELQRVAHYANLFVRNPSLVNPFPHLLKNMLYKYGLSGGSFKRLAPDFYQYLYAPETLDPALVAKFKEVMPFTESGQTVYEMVQGAVPTGSLLERAGHAVNAANRWSSKKIFAEWDPALRYARWNQYVKQGMDPQAAANHVWIDLVRYGTRSDWVDFLKAVPANFFVPWRIGTLRTTLKAFQSTPARAALFIGAVDIIREADYRATGRWTHLPIDYIEKPLYEVLHDPKAIGKTLGLTLAFGPSGEYTASTLHSLLKGLEGKGQMEDVKRLMWGLSQIYDLGPEYAKFQQTGDVSHLVNILGLVLVGRHGTLAPPKRFGAYLPEVPGLEKSQEVIAQEQAWATKQGKRDLLEERKALRKAVP